MLDFSKFSQAKNEALIDEVNNLFKRIKKNEISNTFPDELRPFISPKGLLDIYKGILENEEFLKAQLIKKINNKQVKSIRLSKKDTGLPRTLNIVRDPVSGEFALILETKHKTANGQKDNNIPSHQGGRKKGVPAWRIDSKKPEKWINLVISNERYISNDPKLREKQSNDANNEIKNEMHDEIKIAKTMNKKGAEVAKELGHPLFQTYSFGESFYKPIAGKNKIENFKFKQSIYSPYAIGTLEDARKLNLSEADKNDIALSLLKEVEVLHKNATIHQDIKAKNILIYQKENGKYYAKLADFGLESTKVALATYDNESPEISLAHSVPTDQYYSYFHNNAYRSFGKWCADDSKSSTKKEDRISFSIPHASNDMWALGITLYEFYVGRLPSINKNSTSTDIKTISNNINKHPILKGLLNPKRELRFTANEAVLALEGRKISAKEPQKTALVETIRQQLKTKEEEARAQATLQKMKTAEEARQKAEEAKRQHREKEEATRPAQEVMRQQKENDEAKHDINFDFSKRCKTTGWYNNCGVNCLTHFLVHKLESGELINRFNNDREYDLLLQTFQEYYGFSRRPTWDELRILIGQYVTPTDREGIVGPVLRKHLEKILARNAKKLWNEFATVAYSDYISKGNVGDVAGPVFYSNQKMLDILRAEFIEELSQELKKPSSDYEVNIALNQLFENDNFQPSKQQIEEQIRFQRTNNVQDKFLNKAKDFWLNEGCQSYAAWMGNLNNAEMISADELVMLGNALQIGIEVYTPESIIRALDNPVLGNNTRGAQMPQLNYPWTLKIFNQGVHWEYQEPEMSDISEDIANAHNLHYPNEFDESFYLDDYLSGEFKLYGNQDPKLSEYIIQGFRGQYESLVQRQNFQAQNEAQQRQVRIQQEAQARAEQEAKARVEAQAKEAQVKAEQEAKARVEAQAKEAQVKVQQELALKEAQAKAEREAQIKAQQELALKEAQAKAQQEAIRVQQAAEERKNLTDLLNKGFITKQEFDQILKSQVQAQAPVIIRVPQVQAPVNQVKPAQQAQAQNDPVAEERKNLTELLNKGFITKQEFDQILKPQPKVQAPAQVRVQQQQAPAASQVKPQQQVQAQIDRAAEERKNLTELLNKGFITKQEFDQILKPQPQAQAPVQARVQPQGQVTAAQVKAQQEALDKAAQAKARQEALAMLKAGIISQQEFDFNFNPRAQAPVQAALRPRGQAPVQAPVSRRRFAR